jgi:hypothetical protein
MTRVMPMFAFLEASDAEVIILAVNAGDKGIFIKD